MSWRHHQLHAGRWNRTKRAVFQRDGHRCRGCGRLARLQAHHDPPLRRGGNPYDITGIISLCKPCHQETHRHDRRELTEDEVAWKAMLAELV